MTRHTSATRQQALGLYASGMATRDVSEALGISLRSVSTWVGAAGIMRSPKKVATKAERLQGVALARDGWTVLSIARELGRAPSTVQGWLAAEWQKSQVGPQPASLELPREQLAAQQSRQALAHFIPMPLKPGGWYANGWWGR